MNIYLRKAGLFLLITLLFMVIALWSTSQNILPQPFVLLGICGPAITAILFRYQENGLSGVGDLLKGYVRFKAAPRHYAIASIAVPCLAVLGMAISDVIGVATFTQWIYPLIPQALIFILIISIGEELGWRGYLQPLLRQRYSLFWSSLIVGGAWAAWHLPGYYFGTGVVEGLAAYWFMLWVLGAALIAGLLYERTQSVFIAIVFHSSANLAFNLFPFLPQHGAPTAVFVIFLGLVWIVALALMYRAYNQVQRTH